MIIKETKLRKVELYDTETTDSIAENYTSIINLGEDVNREGILMCRAATMQYLTHGYGLD
jgi:hypothetical protein